MITLSPSSGEFESKHTISLIRQKEKLIEFSNAALRITDEQEFFDYICKELTLFLDCNLTGIYKYDIRKNQFDLVAVFERQVKDTLQFVYNNPNTLAGFTFLKNHPVFYEDIKNDPIISNSPLLKIFNVISGFSSSIQNSFGKWGVFGSISVEGKKISKKDSNFFQGVSETIGLYLENQRKNENAFVNYSLDTAIRFTRGIAHDFNNYLSILENYIELLQQGITTNKTSNQNSNQIFNNITFTIEKSKDLIKQLQSLGKKENSTYNKININEIIIDMKNILNQKSNSDKSKNIDIEYNLMQDFPLEVFGNVTQLSQVMLNLVTNGIEAINTKGRITISTKKLIVDDPKSLFEVAYLGLKPSNYVQISVSDDGIGMDKEILNNIFTPYVKGEKTGSNTSNNLGLGLSIVNGIIRQMKGEIKVSSERNKGTKFDIFIPSIN